MPYDLHIVRTSDWLDAANSPISREDVDRLIQTDPELGWSSSDFVEMENGTRRTRFYMIAWHGNSCFWWYKDQIMCASPDER